MKKHLLYNTVALLVLCLFFTACKRKLATPDNDSKKIFGKWNLVAWTSDTMLPATDVGSHATCIEFKEDGTYEESINSGKAIRSTFSLSRGGSIYNNSNTLVLTISDTQAPPHINDAALPLAVTFGGNDSLYVYVPGIEHVTQVYIRKK